jgi:hypothetical protein
MKQSEAMNPKTALKNIESSMRAEGFHVSNKTKVACSEILKSGRNASQLANYHVAQTLKKVR